MKKIKFIADKCLACKTCELQCAVTHANTNRINDGIWTVPQPFPRLKIITEKDKIKILRCIECKKPKCVEACESWALRIEDSTVILDEDKCTGCWNCIESCPFKSIFKNEFLGIAVKCDLCDGREKLACVEACPTGALILSEKEEVCEKK